MAGLFGRCTLLIGAILLLALTPVLAHAQDDVTMGWLLNQATTAPATHPASQPSATQPANPLTDPSASKGIEGTITMSNGRHYLGRISTTPEKPIRIWSEDEAQYHDIPLELIQSITAQVLWQRQEAQWHFTDSGSDIKEYTGKTYPARELLYDVTLINGQTLHGGISAPLYIFTDGHSQQLILYKRQKGPIDQELTDLLYIQHVTLGQSDAPTTQPAP